MTMIESHNNARPGPVRAARPGLSQARARAVLSLSLSLLSPLLSPMLSLSLSLSLLLSLSRSRSLALCLTHSHAMPAQQLVIPGAPLLEGSEVPSAYP